MLTVQPHRALAPLGQVPYAAELSRLARNLNRPDCIGSRQFVPIVKSAMDFASEQAPSRFSFYRLLPGSPTESDRKQMQQAYWALNYWFERFSTEAPKQYCKGKTDGQPSNDRWLITQAIAKPYQIASGIVGANLVLQEAIKNLGDDLLLNIPSAGPPWWLDIRYLAPIGVAAVAAGLYARTKAGRPIAPPAPVRAETEERT